MEFTDNKVGYEMELAGRGGARFFIYPLRGRHTGEDVVKAKRQIRVEHDCKGIKVEWVDSYHGQLFRQYRDAINILWIKKQLLLDRLSNQYRHDFLQKTITNQRYLVWQLWDNKNL